MDKTDLRSREFYQLNNLFCAMNYNSDNRIVLTLDAGGTNFVFSAIQANREIVQPVTLPSEAHDLDRSLKNIIQGFTSVKQLLDEDPVAISFAFPGPSDYPRGIMVLCMMGNYSLEIMPVQLKFGFYAISSFMTPLPKRGSVFEPSNACMQSMQGSPCLKHQHQKIFLILEWDGWMAIRKLQGKPTMKWLK